MKLAFILSSSRRAFGGIETIADNLALGLAARGHQVSFVAGSARPLWRNPQSIDAVEVSTVEASSQLARQIARLIRTAPLNVQSLLFFVRYLVTPQARQRVETSDVAVTFFEGEAVLFSRFLAPRGIGTAYYYSGGIDPRWAVLDRSTRRVAISHAVAIHSAIHHAYPSHGVVCPGVARAWLARPCAADRARDPQRLVYTGRLERVPKHPEHLITCFAALASEFPSLTLRLVGDGPTRQDLERRACQIKLASRVIFTGAQPPAGIAAELQQADVFLFPSTYESFGISALEAMAAGVPVVASDLPALREATGGQAFLVPAGDTASWVETIRRLLRDRDLRRDRSRAGRIWAKQLTWDRAAALMERYLVQAQRRSGAAVHSASAGESRSART